MADVPEIIGHGSVELLGQCIQIYHLIDCIVSLLPVFSLLLSKMYAFWHNYPTAVNNVCIHNYDSLKSGHLIT